MALTLLSKPKYIILLIMSVNLLACTGVTEKSLTDEKGRSTLSWTPPTLNADNTDLTDLAAYNIYYGTSEDSLTEYITVDKDLTEYSIDNLSAYSKYYFAVKAVNSEGVESAFSNLAEKTF